MTWRLKMLWWRMPHDVQLMAFTAVWAFMLIVVWNT